MILVTGMPRTGTSFLQRAITHCIGPIKVKKVPKFFSLREAGALAYLAQQGLRDEMVTCLEIIEKIYSKGKIEPVFKHPYMSFFPDQCMFFSKVIIAYDDVSDRWMKSAESWNVQRFTEPKFNLNNLIDVIEDESTPVQKRLRVIGDIWKEKCFDLQHFLLANQKEVYLCKFDCRDDYDHACKSLNLPVEKYKAYWEDNWRGSRFED